MHSHTRPGVFGSARVLLFPAHRAPNRDSGEGAAGGAAPHGLFQGMKILVVEDDFIVAFDIQVMLEEQGAQVLGPASSVYEAMALCAREAPHAAVLDVNLNGEFVFPVAQLLSSRRVPFLFATAYADDDRLFPPEAQQAPRLAKPVLPAVLITQLQKLIGNGPTAG